MMKKKFFNTSIIVITSLIALFVLSCNIGLGEAVDTANPTVEISYPPKNAVIRESFVAAGTCDDDLALDYVNITLTNLSTKTIYGPYTADLNEDKTSWKVLLNQKAEGSYTAFNSYKKWEFPDGDYILTAISYDKNKNASQEATIPISIDNTAPVLLVSKPLAFGTEKPSVYGRTLNIIGDISEEHETKKLTLYYREYDESTHSFVDSEARTLEISGFGTMSSDNPLTIAKAEQNVQNAGSAVLTQNYNTIYGEIVNISDPVSLAAYTKKIYYCGFLLEDSAKIYKDPADSGVEEGNKTTQYYILSDDFNKNLFSEETKSLNARNLMLLLRGQSSYSDSEIPAIVSSLNSTGNTASSQNIDAALSSKFSIDPKSNPVWSISNFEYDSTEEDFTTYETGSAVPLVLKSGGDGIAINKPSITIELYHLGLTPAPITGSTPHITLVSNCANPDVELKTKLTELDTNTSMVFSDGSSGLKINHYYEFKITGEDMSGNSIESEDGYRFGFKRYSSFASPRISFESPSSGGYYKENEYYSGDQVNLPGNAGGIKIKGKVVTAAKQTSVNGALANDIEIGTAEDLTDHTTDKIWVSKITVIDTTTSEERVIPAEDYSCTISDFSRNTYSGSSSEGYTYNFTAEITKAAGKTLNPETPGSYKVKVALIAEDSLTVKSDPTEFEFKLDNKKPEITTSEIVVSPTVTEEGLNYVNGVVKISGTVSDSGSGLTATDPLYYYQTGDTDPTPISLSGVAWSFNFDTTVLTDNSDYTLNIYAKDKVGNILELPYPLKIKQESDYPKISFSNINDNTIFTNPAVLIGNVTDDDGLQQVEVFYQKLGSGTAGAETSVSFGNLIAGSTSCPLAITLSDADGAGEGEYRIFVKAKDTKNLATGKVGYGNTSDSAYKPAKTIDIKKDNGAPVLGITNSSSAQTYYNHNFDVEGTVKDGSGQVTISRKVYKNGTELTSLPEGFGTITVTGSVVEGADWTDSIPVLSLGNGTYKIEYYAADKYAVLEGQAESHTSSQIFEFSVDVTPPSLISNSLKMDGNSISTGWYNKNNGLFSVKASDANSTVASVVYSLNYSESATPSSVSWNNMESYTDSTNTSGQTSWKANITFEGSEFVKHLALKAIDSAGNESIIEQKSLRIDTNAPVLTVKDSEGNNLAETIYINNTAEGFEGFEISGIYNDGTGESGIETDTSGNVIPLKFTIGNHYYDAESTTETLVPAVFSVFTYDSTNNTYSTVINPNDFGTDGGKLSVIGKDNAGNKKVTASTTFIVDTEAPKIEDIEISAPSAYKKTAGQTSEYYIRKSDGAFTISGTATDDGGLFENIKLTITGQGETTIGPFTSTNSSWTFNDSAINLSTWTSPATVTLEATDKAKNKKTLSFAIKFDEDAPQIITGEGPDNRYNFRGEDIIKYNNLKLGEGRYCEYSYGRLNSVDFEIFVEEEGSGLSKLEYKLFTSGSVSSIPDFTTSGASQTGSFLLKESEVYSYYDSSVGSNVSGTAWKASASIPGFAPTTGNNTNYLVIRPTDNCGNTGDVTVLSVHVDQTSPVVLATHTEQLTNGTKKIELSGSAYDVDSGIKALRVLVNGVAKMELNADSLSGTVIHTDGSQTSADGVVTNVAGGYGTFSYKGYAPDKETPVQSPVNPTITASTPTCTLKNAASYVEWNLILDPEGEWFENAGERPVISIEVEDWAEHDGLGNKNPTATKIATLRVDTQAPAVTITSPVINTTTPTRLNGENTISGTSSDEGSSPAKLDLYYSTETTAPTELSGYTRLKTLTTASTPSNPDTLTTYNRNISQLYNYSFTVDFYNFVTSSEITKPVWILVVATDEAGNTSIDDGISPVKYIVDRNTDRPVISISEYSLKPKNNVMSADNRVLLKEKQIFIDVTDDDGLATSDYAFFRIGRINATTGATDYTNWTAITLNSGNGSFELDSDGKQIIEFKIKDAKNTEFTSTASDWKKVYVEDLKGNKYGLETEDSPYADPVIYTTLDTELPVVTIEGVSTDDGATWTEPDSFTTVLGGITESVKFKIRATDNGSGIKTDAAGNQSADAVTLTKKIGSGEGQAVTVTPSTAADEANIYYATIDCTSGDGLMNITVVAQDNASRTGTATKQFRIDNTDPEITVSTPASGSEQSDQIYAIGTFTESVSFWYAVSPVVTSPDSTTSWTYIKKNPETGVETTGNTFPVTNKAGETIPLASLATVCAYKEFSDSAVSTFNIQFDGVTNSTPDHTYDLNGWLKAMGITIQDDLVSTTNPFDDLITLYLHLKAVDSAGNKKEVSWPILVNPQGSRPTVEFSYPAANEENPILGGKINLMGSAKGKHTITEVYMQIDCNNDGNWTTADETILASDDYGYTLENIPGLYYPGTTTLQKGIKINVNGSVWSQKINENREFNPAETGTPRQIKVRVYARDTSAVPPLLSSAKIKSFRVDNDLPQIDQDIKLVQWNTGFDASTGLVVDADNGTISFANGAVKAQRSYSDRMYVSGKWSVIGKVTDDSGISQVALGETEDTATAIGNSLGSDGSIKKAFVTGGKTNYVFCFPVGSDSTNAVDISEVTLRATDNGSGSNAKTQTKQFIVNYDNKAPDVTPIAANKKIFNTNGLYTIESEAYENTVNNKNQSGIERIVFYFTRNVTSQATKIFDPMLKVNTSGNMMDYSGLPYEDDLYWQSAVVTEVNQTSITVSSLPSCAHKYGLAKVNGVIYRIESIEGTSVTLSGAPGETTSALFAIANVIDNTNPENIPGEYNTLTTDYGYGYPTGIYDDGDLMPEHLTKVGTKYNWDATINSRNISDGSVTLHYIAFDKAGNRAALDVAAMVQNNAPRIAGAKIGIDENGNGNVDEDEFYNNDLYSNCYEGGMDGAKKAIDVTIPKTSTAASPVSAIKIRRTLVIKPEIVGGNGSIGYTYTVAKRNAANTDWADPYYNPENPEVVTLGTGTAENESNMSLTGEGIIIEVKDFLANGITNDANQKFAFTIHDSTPGESQKAVMNVIMDVELNDTTPALNKIIPFYWKDTENNSLAENSREKGHIELSKDLPSSFTEGGTGIYGLNPKISGAIKLEGIAKDNSLLKNLSVKLTNSEGTVLLNQVIAEYNGSWPEETTGSGWSTKITQATYGELLAAGYITAIPSGKTADQKVPYASQEYGHVVHWIWTLDTETAGIAVQAGLVITVGALDYGKPSLNGSGDTATAVYENPNAFANNGVTGTVAQTGGNNGEAAHTCKYTVDVVPYIRGFKTALSKKSKKEDTSEYDRTALGHYPVARTERIGVYGFNLSGATLYDSPIDAEGNALTSHTAVLGTTKTKDIDGDGKNDTSIFVYTTAADALVNFTSSNVYVKVGDIESLNNKNYNDAQGSYGVAAADIPERNDYGKEDTYETFSNFYNRMPNETSNYGLTDDTYLDIWYFDSRAAKPHNPGVISDPVMKINPDSGIIGFAYQSGPRYFSMANSTNSYETWMSDYDNMSATGFTYDSAGNTYGTALGGDINGTSSIAKLAFMTSRWGHFTWVGGNTDYAVNKTDNADTFHLRVEQIGQIGTKADKSPAGNNNKTDAEGNYIDKSRVLSPSLAVSGSGANAKVYMAYYDHMNQEIRFRWASNPKTTPGWDGIGYIQDTYRRSNLGNNGNKKNIAGVNENSDKYNTVKVQIIAESKKYTYTNNVGSEITSHSLGKPGSYVAIDVIPNGGGTGDNKYDVIVLVWYDEENGNLWYTYNTIDFAALAAGTNKAQFEGSSYTDQHWRSPTQIFTGAGQYCQIKVAGDKSIHIAAYDKDAGDIRYAKLGSYVIDGDHPYSEDTMSCVVDSNGIVGTNLTIDVAMNGTGNNAKAIPYISYYGSFGPKMAYLTEEGAALTSLAKGTAKKDGDCFTGYWEVSNVPTPSNAPKDRVNVAVWKTTAGVIKSSAHTADTTHAGSGTTSANGTTYGNGTAYPVVAYEIRPTSAEGYMETAQMQ